MVLFGAVPTGDCPKEIVNKLHIEGTSIGYSLIWRCALQIALSRDDNSQTYIFRIAFVCIRHFSLILFSLVRWHISNIHLKSAFFIFRFASKIMHITWVCWNDKRIKGAVLHNLVSSWLPSWGHRSMFCETAKVEIIPKVAQQSAIRLLFGINLWQQYHRNLKSWTIFIASIVCEETGWAVSNIGLEQLVNSRERCLSYTIPSQERKDTP